MVQPFPVLLTPELWFQARQNRKAQIPPRCRVDALGAGVSRAWRLQGRFWLADIAEFGNPRFLYASFSMAAFRERTRHRIQATEQKEITENSVWFHRPGAPR
jgi:hypothetical protein